MPKFGDYVRRAREELGWTQQQLATRMQGSVPNLQRIERMATPATQGRTYASLAEAFGMTTAQLDKAWRGSVLPKKNAEHRRHPLLGRAIPVINKVSASRFMEKTNLDYPDGIADLYMYAPVVTDEEAFAWTVDGDCMLPEYEPGDLVVCSPNAKFLDGADYFVQLTPAKDSVNTFKRVFREGLNYRLKSINPKYPDLVVHRDDIHTMALAILKQRFAGPKELREQMERRA